MDGYYKWFSYSSTERWTGRFDVDGKPIYCQTLDNKTVSQTGIDIDIGTILNVNNIKHLYGSFTRGTKTINIIPFGHLGVNDGVYIAFDGAKNAITVMVGNGWSGITLNISVAVEYTKTTDTAGIIPPFVAP